MKVAPQPGPSLSTRTVPPCRLDEMPHDRKAETQSAMRPSGAGVGLTESFEHVRQEFGGDANAVVGDADLDGVSDRLDRDFDPAALRREPHGVRQEVAHNLLKPARVAGHHRCQRQGSA